MLREPRALLIDVNTSAALRAKLGPRPWQLLEALASEAPFGARRVAMVCSARSLAALTGCSKDSVARSLRTLIDAGIVTRERCRDEHSGRFASVRYLVDLAAVGISVVPASLDPPPVLASTDPGRTRSRSAAVQHALFS